MGYACIELKQTEAAPDDLLHPFALCLAVFGMLLQRFSGFKLSFQELPRALG